MEKLSYAGIAVFLGIAVLILKNYMAGGRFTGNEKINGKTVIITGANTGIGKETALELARRGGRVVMACRDLGRAKKARDDIVQETGSENVVVKQLDLNSMASIRKFAKDILESEPHIDILINNAGVMWCPKGVTEDGIETQIGVNHFGHFLLTMLLLDRLKSSSPSRIINVSSLAHERGTIDFDDLNSDKDYNPRSAYSQSKLANVLFTRELAKKLQNTGVTVNALHPGVVMTELGRHISLFENPVFQLFFTPLALVMVKTPEQGAQTTIHCALASELEGVSGKYFSDCQEKAAAAQALDDDAAQRLWKISEEWTKLS